MRQRQAAEELRVCIKNVGTTSLTNCRFHRNYVKLGFGGGLLAIKTSGPSCQLQNCIFVKNTVDRGSGGGASAEGHDFVNLTFFGNELNQDTEGVDPAMAFFWPNPQVPGHPSVTSLRNSIIWANYPPPGESWYQMEGAAAIHCDIEDGHFWQPAGGTQSYGNISRDPKFRDEPVDLRLRPTSPANNAGENTSVLTDATDVDDSNNNTETTPWDLAKIKRIINVVEMGAFESCIGDLDNDLDVDITDLAQMLSSFGMPPNCPTGQYCAADLDDSGDIDIQDLAILLSNFGSVCRPGEGDGLVGGGDSLTGGGDPTTEWIRNATIEDILRWWEAGIAPIGDDTR